MSDKKSIETMKFEAALAELEEIVQKLDTGAESLESAIESFERGIKLKSHCENKLKEAKLKIEKVTQGEPGEVKLEEVDFS